jgi:hypothetical protein
MQPAGPLSHNQLLTLANKTSPSTSAPSTSL